MKPDLWRLAASAKDLLRPGGVERLKKRLEDRIFGAVLDSTRLTNDGSYRRYRDEPTRRGEWVEGAVGDASAGAQPGSSPGEAPPLSPSPGSSSGEVPPAPRVPGSSTPEPS